MYRHTANAPKVNQGTTDSTTKTHTHTHKHKPTLMDLPGSLALKNAGKAEGVTDNINPGWNKTMRQRNEDILWLSAYEPTLKLSQTQSSFRYQIPALLLTSGWGASELLVADLDLRTFDMLRGSSPNLQRTQQSWRELGWNTVSAIMTFD